MEACLLTLDGEETSTQHVGRFFWIAEEAGAVVGFLPGSLNGDSQKAMHYQVLEKGEHHLSLDQVYVHPSFRNRGMGGQLVSCFRAAAEATGIFCCLLLSQNVNWPRTLRFYQKHGFRPWYFTMFMGWSIEERTQNTE